MNEQGRGGCCIVVVRTFREQEFGGCIPRYHVHPTTWLSAHLCHCTSIPITTCSPVSTSIHFPPLVPCHRLQSKRLSWPVDMDQTCCISAHLSCRSSPSWYVPSSPTRSTQRLVSIVGRYIARQNLSNSVRWQCTIGQENKRLAAKDELRPQALNFKFYVLMEIVQLILDGIWEKLQELIHYGSWDEGHECLPCCCLLLRLVAHSPTHYPLSTFTPTIICQIVSSIDNASPTIIHASVEEKIFVFHSPSQLIGKN